jgi:hypothetical protein
MFLQHNQLRTSHLLNKRWDDLEVPFVVPFIVDEVKQTHESVLNE